MTEIRLEIPINCYNEEHRRKVYDVFSGFTLYWTFEDLPTCEFQTTIADMPHLSAHEETAPVSVAFCCHIPVTTEDESSIFWLDSDENEYYEWDEFHFYDLRRLYMALTLSIALAYPELNIACAPISFFIGGKQFKSELCFMYPMQNDAYNSHPEVFTSAVSLQKTFDWLVGKTDSFHSKKKPMGSVSALSYIMNREIRETLVYSSIGLESIYVPEAHNERRRLIQRIKLAFPNIPTEGIIDKMYTLRSKFVHGEYSMGVYPLMLPLQDSDEKEVEQVARFSIAILIESMRMLIAHNAIGMKFSEITTYDFQV